VEKFKASVGFSFNHIAFTITVINYDDEYILASCRWCFQSEFHQCKFPFNEIGYKKACEYIEQQRIKLIEELL